MRLLSSSVARLTLALALLFAAGADLQARPAAAVPAATAKPAAAAAGSGVLVSGLLDFQVKPTNRTRVVQIAGVAMALALFIIIRSTKKH